MRAYAARLRNVRIPIPLRREIVIKFHPPRKQPRAPPQMAAVVANKDHFEGVPPSPKEFGGFLPDLFHKGIGHYSLT
jgi:hypothetical protein